MTPREPLTVAQVARELGHTVEWFYRHRAALETAHGFPPPMPGLGKRWDPTAIKLWKDRAIPAHLRDAAPAATDEDELEAARTELERRCGELGKPALRIVGGAGRMA